MKIEFALVMMTAAALAIPARCQAMDHHSMVMSHGAQVMPFDQKLAMHMFSPNASGGTLEVMVHNMDPNQIARVRAHLRSEAAHFATGDYSDPTYIHGASHARITRNGIGYGGRPLLVDPIGRQDHLHINGSHSDRIDSSVASSSSQRS